MKRLLIAISAFVAALLVMRPPLFAQDYGNGSDTGSSASEPGQDNPDNGGAQAAPEQGTGDDSAEQNSDSDENSESPGVGEQQNDQDQQSEQGDSQAGKDHGMGDDSNQ